MNIKFENFSFKYKDMDRCILKDVSFSVCPGDFILLAGSSGGGKTTLLKCFKEEIRPKGETTGSIDLGDLGGQDIGFVFSDIDDQIVNDTVRGELAFGLENLGLSTDEIRRRLFYICNYFDIETWLDRKMDTLSSGQKQIINIASVMAMKPKVLILDSPDGALYPAARRRLYNILKDINKDFGTTIIIASHLSMEVIPFANKVFYLNDGRLAVYEDILEFKDYYLKEIANYKEEKNDKKNNEAENIVQIKNLWFRYNKFDKFILRDLSFDIKKGQISIIIGGNGSGKTTLLRIIGGFLKQARGKVVKEKGIKINYFPMEVRALFIEDTVGEVLDIPWEEDEKNLPPSLLSTGKMRALGLLKVINQNPDIILMDEPSGGLDFKWKNILASIIKEYVAPGGTVVMVTHDNSFANEIGDSINILFDGSIITKM